MISSVQTNRQKTIAMASRFARAASKAKLKKSLENLPFGIDWAKVSPIDLKSIPGESLSKSGKFISIFGRCEGFTYYSENNRKRKGSGSGKKGISDGIFFLKTALRPRRRNLTIDKRRDSWRQR